MPLRSVVFRAAVLLAALGAAGAAAAADGGSAAASDSVTVETPRESLERGLLAIDLRYRLEFVDSASFEKDALASTLRGALTFETASYRGLFAGVTFETVTAIGNDQLYNNLGVGSLNNGVTDRPVVADPEIIEVDRIFLAYRGGHGLELRAGRFDYVLDNQRFIGIAPWRQNHRSYEALSFAVGSRDVVRFKYAYLNRAHYNTGASLGIGGHLFNLSRDVGPGSLSGYAYLLDWDDIDRARLSSATYGLRFSGSSSTTNVDLHYFAEYARQVDHGDNPGRFGLDYGHLGLGVQRGPWRLQAAWELKDGDGTNAVQTPLGTNHGKNGFADRMVVTPPDGSHDRYLRLTMQTDRWSWLLAYHDFEAVRGGAGLGTEIDFQGGYEITDPLSVFLKVARYDADTWLTDVTKVMLWASWSFDNRF
jgi:hypothetical protein